MTLRNSLPMWTGWLALAVVLAAGWSLQRQALLNHDVAWLMIAAGRMLAGGTYLHDFFEVNLPLAIAAYAPPYLLLHAWHLPWQGAVAACGVLLALQAALLSALSLDQETVQGSAARRAWLAALVLAGLLLLPGYDFFQKEHLVLLLGLPFICAMTRAPQQVPLARPLRLYLSLLAALGFFLKPHYAPLPFLLLGLRAARARSWAPLLSLEAAALLAVGLAYAAVVLLLYPDWLVCARWAADLYAAYEGQGLLSLLRADGLAPAAAGLVLELLLWWRLRALRAVLEPLLACALYAAAAYLLQFKGWSYQLLPLLLLVHCGLALALVRGWPASGKPGLGALAPLPGLLLSALAALAATLAMPVPAALEQLPQVLAAARPGDTVYVLSFELPPFLPAVPLAGMQWGSRYAHLWPLVRLARAEFDGDPERARLEQTYRGPLVASIVEDLRQRQPQLVIVDRRPEQSLPRDYDIAAALARSPEFAAAWRAYERIGQVLSGTQPEFDIYWKSAPADAAQ